MPRFGFGHGATASAVFGFAAAALLGAHQLTNTDAFAEMPQTSDVQTVQTVQTVQAVRTVASEDRVTYAAVQPGQWEELVKPTPVPTIAPTPVPTIAPTPAPTEVPRPKVFESGVASTYGTGDGFEGNRTACGQIFHTRFVQVAHKTLPCGTMIRVEDTATGLSVEAEVTDRGPYIPGRIVDLSWAAFRQLDPTGPGLLHVNVYVLDQ